MRHLGTKILQTDKLLLRPFTKDDGPAMYKNWASDPKVTKYLTWPAHADESVSCAIARDWEERSANDNFYQWRIVPKDVAEPIGSISAVQLDDAVGKVHIGYCIGRKWWHQGITSRRLAMVIEFFFTQVGANRVDSRHDTNNPHSGDVMKKCGMKYEGTLRQSDINNQGLCDAAYYGILKEEWENERK